nr:hypothetical protein [uncultured Rhodoferax sp.]
MKYWIRAAVILMGLGSQLAVAEDLFLDGKPRKVAQYSELPAGSTVGDYPLYTGGRTWYVLEQHAGDNNMDLRILSVALGSPQDGDFFAEMSVTVSAGVATSDGYFSADLCSPSRPHLFMLNKASGRIDNCLILDPYVAKMRTGDTTLFHVKVRNSQSSWRLYDMSLMLNPAKLGFPATTAADWSPSAVAADPKKKQSVDKIVAWAKQLQEGVNKAIAFSKPQDAFDGVPPIQTLLTAD